MIKKLKKENDYIEALEQYKSLIINNIKESKLCEKWDGLPTNITPEEHFNNIITWCDANIKSRIWSDKSSSKNGFRTSYGAKHKCEKDLKCYVANNWMKLAMIYSGLEVTYNRLEKDGDKINIQDICENSINFICRRNLNNYYGIKYKCLSEYFDNKLKYN